MCLAWEVDSKFQAMDVGTGGLVIFYTLFGIQNGPITCCFVCFYYVMVNYNL